MPPPINKFTPEQEKMLETIWPSIRKFIVKVNDASDDLLFTGFLYGGSEDNPILIHVGNIQDKGEDLFRIHCTLSWMAAEMDNRGLSENRELKDGPEGPTPEEIADKMALALMATPLNEHQDHLQELVQQYLKSRAEK